MELKFQKQNSGKSTSIWKITFLSNTWNKKETKRKSRKNFNWRKMKTLHIKICETTKKLWGATSEIYRTEQYQNKERGLKSMISAFTLRKQKKKSKFNPH